jgi:hypothetical protein
MKGKSPDLDPDKTGGTGQIANTSDALPVAFMLCPARLARSSARVIGEASQTSAIVGGDEGEEIGVAFGMVAKAAMGPQLRSAGEMLAEAAVEALDHAVGLRVKGADQAVGDRMPGADAIDTKGQKGTL